MPSDHNPNKGPCPFLVIILEDYYLWNKVKTPKNMSVTRYSWYINSSLWLDIIPDSDLPHLTAPPPPPLIPHIPSKSEMQVGGCRLCVCVGGGWYDLQTLTVIKYTLTTQYLPHQCLKPQSHILYGSTTFHHGPSRITPAMNRGEPWSVGKILLNIATDDHLPLCSTVQTRITTVHPGSTTDEHGFTTCPHRVEP